MDVPVGTEGRCPVWGGCLAGVAAAGGTRSGEVHRAGSERPGRQEGGQRQLKAGQCMMHAPLGIRHIARKLTRSGTCTRPSEETDGGSGVQGPAPTDTEVATQARGRKKMGTVNLLNRKIHSS